MARVLILFAHPAFHRSIANSALLAAARDLPGVTVHDLYDAYPDLLIDVEHEQNLLLGHDAIVFQHPFYWYSCPAIVKEWLDLVLDHGFAYGETGTALRGKAWMQAVTVGGLDTNYRDSGLNRFTIAELLRPFEATAHLCGCHWWAPFVVHGAHLIDQTALAAEARRYRAVLEALRAHDAADAPALAPGA